MKIEKIELVAVDVKNLNAAVKLFSKVLGTTFTDLSGIRDERVITKDADRAFEETKRRAFIARNGVMELIESTPSVNKEGLRALCLKVTDLEKAKAEMEQLGIRLMTYIKFGGVKEAVFHPDDLNGIRLVLVEYSAPTFVDATLQK